MLLISLLSNCLSIIILHACPFICNALYFSGQLTVAWTCCQNSLLFSSLLPPPESSLLTTKYLDTMTIQVLCTCVWVQNMDCKKWALEEVKTLSWLLECRVGVQDWQLEYETNSLPIHTGHASHLWIASVSKQEDRGEAEIFILLTAGRATLDGTSQKCSPMSELSTLRHALKHSAGYAPSWHWQL